MALTQISTAGVKDDAVTAGKIPADAIGSSEIAANAVGSSELADNAVDTAAIADDAVTFAKLENVAQNHIVGRVSSGTGDAQELNAGEVRTLLNVADGATNSPTTVINNNGDNKIITGSSTANNVNAEGLAIIDNSGRLKLGNIDNSADITNTPLYLEVQSDMTAVGTAEGGASTGLFRMYDDSTNTDRYHGLELRNRSSGDIRILNHDRNSNDKGDLVIAMPQTGLGGGVQEKIRVSGVYDSIQIAGKGGATINSNLGEDLQKTDIYITTKTGMTSPTMNAGSELAGIIRFHEVGSNDNRYHGLELRNRRSGDVRFLNADRGADNKADAVICCDSGSQLFENARFLNTGGIAFNGDTSADNALDDYEEGTFTPTVLFGGANTASYNSRSGYYTKIGNLVWVKWAIDLSSRGGSGSGRFDIGGLPFTITDKLSSTGQEVAGAFTYWTGTMAWNWVSYWGQENSTHLQVQYTTGDGNTTITQYANRGNLNDSSGFRGWVMYNAS